MQVMRGNRQFHFLLRCDDSSVTLSRKAHFQFGLFDSCIFKFNTKRTEPAPWFVFVLVWGLIWRKTSVFLNVQHEQSSCYEAQM